MSNISTILNRTIVSDETVKQLFSIATILVNDNKNLERMDYLDVDILELEFLLYLALCRQAENPQMSKSDIVRCLCKDRICKKVPIQKYEKVIEEYIPRDDECIPCDDEYTPDNNDCSICLESKSSLLCVKTQCSHSYHIGCFNKLVKKTTINSMTWVSCPLCRNHVSILTKESARDKFLFWQNCTCCDRHRQRRPTHFSSSAPFVENKNKCNDDYANLLIELLKDYNDMKPNCKCACRKNMRYYCRIAPV